MQQGALIPRAQSADQQPVQQAVQQTPPQVNSCKALTHMPTPAPTWQGGPPQMKSTSPGNGMHCRLQQRQIRWTQFTVQFGIQGSLSREDALPAAAERKRPHVRTGSPCVGKRLHCRLRA